MGMHDELDAKWEEEKAKALEVSGQKKSKVTPIRPPRGGRKQNSAAAKAEALGEGIVFEFDGKTYEVEPAQDWDIDVFESFASEDLMGMINGVKLLIGLDQYNEFKTDVDGNKVKRTIEDLGSFLNMATGQLGVTSAE